MIELEPHTFQLCTEPHLFNSVGPHCHWCDRPESDEIHKVPEPAAA